MGKKRNSDIELFNKSDEAYYGDRKYVTNSMLGRLKKSPQHLKYYLEHPQKDTEALATVMLASDQKTSAKERIWDDTRRKRLRAWGKTQWAPEHGWRPTPPVLEGKPGPGQMLLDIAIAGVGAAGTAYAGFQQADAAESLKKLATKPVPKK